MRILIVGATSAIAQATAKLYASKGNALFLVARNESKLAVMRDDLLVRGAPQVETMVMDACDHAQHEHMLSEANEKLGSIDMLFIAHGTLPDQESVQQSIEATARALDENFFSVVSILTPAAAYFEKQGSGTIAVISSVAGDRGRQSNYVYGTAKGAVSIFLQGLRNRLAPAGVQVLTIKPGFVKTPMTADVAGDGFLWAEPEMIGEGIVKAVEKKRNVVYLPWFWQIIMLIIKSVPEALFKRLKL